MGYTTFERKGLSIASWDGSINGEYEIYIDQEKAGDCYVKLNNQDIKDLIKFLKKQIKNNGSK